LSSIGLWARAEREKEARNGFTRGRNARLAVPREVHPTKVAHAPIRVEEMPAVGANATGRTPGPIMGVGRGRSHDIRRVGGWVVYWLKRKRGIRPKDTERRLTTSRVPTKDTLESKGEVGVEILDGKVVSEVTVGGREGGRA
jgi:hypothetical protein